jgi:predicted phosphodiesterase
MEISEKKKWYRRFYVVPTMLGVIGLLFLLTYGRYFISYDPINGYYVGFGVGAAVILFILTIKLILKFIETKPKIYKYLKRFFAFLNVISLLIMIFGAYYIHFYAVAIKYDTGPMLMWAPEQDPSSEITVLFRSSESKPTEISYGINKENLNLSVQEQKPNIWHQIRISGLIPNTKYYYRINNHLESKIFHFTTAPLEEKSFSFFVICDTRQNDAPLSNLFNPNVPKLMANVLEKSTLNYSFTLVGGDAVSEGDNEATWKSWFDDISVRTTLGSYAPVQYAAGNHERHSDWDAVNFQRYFPLKNKPNFYYSFNYSMLHVQVLDPWNSSSDWWGEFDETQLAWMDEDFDRNKEMKYKIVLLHPPPVKNNQALDNLKPLVEMCNKYNVSAVFYGHDHSFEMNKINSTYYYLIGVGGAMSMEESGFAHVDVNKEYLSTKMHWANGTTQEMHKIYAL